jgi:nucleotide-binding universal stress UspA family protein
MSTVLLATDGSAAAEVAERLLTSINWPAGTTIEVATVVPWLTELVGIPWLAAAPLHTEEIEASELANATRRVREAADRLAARGLTATPFVLRGNPAAEIVNLAREDHADLIVIGSRGLGAIEGALLGSVSGAVTDRAPCPVLVARGDLIRTSMFADDNSEGAAIALAYLRDRPHLLGNSTRCVTVEPTVPFSPGTFDLPIDAQSVQTIADEERALEAETRSAVADHATTLREAGQPAVADAVVGRPGPAIVDLALEAGADLVVVGSRHRSGVTRLVLGSVGRYVLHHALCSVLLVGRLPEPASAATPPLATAATGSDGSPPGPRLRQRRGQERVSVPGRAARR